MTALLVAVSSLLFLILASLGARAAPIPVCVHGALQPATNTCRCVVGYASPTCNYQQRSQVRAMTLALALGWTGAPYFYMQISAAAIVITIIDVLLLFTLVAMAYTGGCRWLGHVLGCCAMFRCGRRTYQRMRYADAVTEKGDIGDAIEGDECCITWSVLGLIGLAIVLMWWAIIVGLTWSDSIVDGNGYPLY